MSKRNSVDRIKSVDLRPASLLKTTVWWVRRTTRDMLGGNDILDVHSKEKMFGRKIHKIYKKTDEFTNDYFPGLTRLTPRSVAIRRLRDAITDLDYTVVDKDENRPWGAFYRINSEEANRFIKEFFPGVDPINARLGNSSREVSPKFLLVAPGQRLSWQYHERRAELWRFLSNGAYHKSMSNSQGKRMKATVDTIVQFAQGERHRLCAYDDQNWTLVAEIWQHTDPHKPSSEADIIRLQDDYSR